jgi:hypothetical protein
MKNRDEAERLVKEAPEETNPASAAAQGQVTVEQPAQTAGWGTSILLGADVLIVLELPLH